MLSQIEQLVEKENIRELKYSYFRGLDANDWAVFESTMTQNCVGLYSDGDVSFENREEIVSFVKEKLSGERMLTLHHGHHPEIEILDENTARGTWYLKVRFSYWMQRLDCTVRESMKTATRKFTVCGR